MKMQKTSFKTGKLAAMFVSMSMAMSLFSVNAAATESQLEKGTYEVDSSLSCYVNAMGGIEFANEELYKGATVTVDDDGQAVATLEFSRGYGEFKIYSIAVNHFIDASEAVPGYYDENGELVKLTEGEGYKLSEDTVANKNGEEVNYVTEITFPVSEDTSDYSLYLYVNSNIMGCQFCDGSGTAGSNTPDASTPYKASFSIDWDSAEKIKTADKTSSESANVTYTVEGGYEVKIPSAITVDPKTKIGEYTVEAEDFIIADGAYVTVTADTSGTLSNGKESLAFTNELAEGTLTKTGDSLDGKVTVTESASATGTYTGTVNFTINYFAE
jgi:hypothetical protein